MRFQPRRQIVLQRLHQSVIDLLVDVKERFPVHRIDPVVHCRSQIQLLPRHVMTRQLSHLTVIDTNVSIDIEHRLRFGQQPDPFLEQFCVPLRRHTGFLAQDLQLGAQRAHLRYPIQPQHIAPLSWRLVAQLLDRFHSGQGHHRQQ